MHTNKPTNLIKEFTYNLLILALLIGLILAAFACTPSREACERNYGQCGVAGEVRVVEKDVTHTVYIPGAHTKEVNIRVDTLVKDSMYVVMDSTGKAELRYWKDRYGRLMAQCINKADTIKIIEKESIITKWVEKPNKFKDLGNDIAAIATVLLAICVMGGVAYGIYTLIKFIRS